jgi:hypothetical protein
MGPNSHIGFHAAYLDEQGQPTESAPANALMGGYLKMMGLSDQALIYITKAGPKDMTWLSPTDAKQQGIEISLLPPSSHRNTPDLPEESSSGRADSGSLESIVTEFVKSYFVHWSDSNVAAVEFFRSIYDEKVNYGGAMMNKNEIIELKQGYVQRWPERIYTVQPSSLQPSCNSASGTCEIKGRFDWDCRSPSQHKRSAGVSMFTMQLSILSPGSIRILGEWGSVIRKEY